VSHFKINVIPNTQTVQLAMLALLAVCEVWTPPSASLPVHFWIRTLGTKKPLIINITYRVSETPLYT